MINSIQQSPPEVHATFKALDLKKALDKVLFASTKEISRFALNVIRFQSDGESLKLTTTDGRRVSVATIQATLPEFEILIDSEKCKALKRLCKWRNNLVEIDSTDAGITFRFSEGPSFESLYANQPKAEFPPIDHVLEEEIPASIPVLEPSEFKRSVKLALLARKNGNRIDKRDPYGNMVHLVATSRKVTVFGKAKSGEASCVAHFPSREEAKAVTVAVNGSYLLDAISKLPRNEPYELGCWKNGTVGISLSVPGFDHRLCSISPKKRGCQNG